jgi:hypothetical protein
MRRCSLVDLCPPPQLSTRAAHAVEAADRLAIVADFVIVLAALAASRKTVRRRARVIEAPAAPPR